MMPQEPTTVLIIEDEHTLLRALARVMSDAGYAVLTATQADVAWQLLETAPHTAIILCDIGLPGMDGLSFMRQVRDKRSDIPVVFITAAPSLDTAIAAVELGAFRYLKKPVDMAQLLDAVRRGVSLFQLAQMQKQAASLTRTPEYERHHDLRRRFEEAIVTVNMVYQPIVDVRAKALLGYEALLRMGSKALAGPLEMFDAAEALDRVFDVGRVVRRRVGGDAKALTPGHMLFVNLHPRELLDDDLYSPTAALSAFAGSVVLEITERSSLSTFEDLKGRLTRLRQMGFRIALDDLGAGYAGLCSFAMLEPQVVKIDMGLTRGIDADPTKEKLVATMITLCRELGITTVAEGVETVAERDVLLRVGCDLMQGYLFARPAPPFASPAF